MKFTFTVTYRPTNFSYDVSAYFDSELDFLRYLNRWNIESKGESTYVATDICHRPTYIAALEFHKKKRKTAAQE